MGISEPACIAVVGAGGKTALCWQLVQDARARGQHALFTTTTKIWEPAPAAFEVCLTHNDTAETLRTLSQRHWTSACLMGPATDMHGTEAIADSYMPVIATKRNGIPLAEVCAIHAALPEVLLVVEADGARRLPLKAPGDHEPMIPACADIVCVVASLDAIGQPLDGRTVHRAEQFAHLTGLAPQTVITPDALFKMLTHPAGGLKGIPAHARAIAVLTQHDVTRPHPEASALLQALVQHGYHQALLWPRPATA